MKPLHQNKNVPVFYHVPKNAGTYTISLLFNYLRFYITDFLKVQRRYPTFVTPRNIVIRKNNLELARILGHDPNNFCGVCELFQKGDPCDETHYFIELEDLDESILLNVSIFAVIIEADGFRVHSEICKNFNKYNLKKFIILRDPVERMFSFFNYINSDSAKHEPTYGIIPNNLSEYVNSHFIEDSWLIRQFANVSDTEGINDNHYDITYNELKHFDVADISNTENLIKQVYANYLNIILSDADRNSLSHDLVSNQSKKHNNDLSEQDLQVVNERMKYEIKLYNNLVEC